MGIMKERVYSKYVNRRSVIIFTLLFLCVAAVTCSGVSLAYVRGMRRERLDYEQKLEGETDRVFNYLQQSLSSSISTGNSVFTARWYNHYRNIAGVYSDEFDGLKRAEIQQDLTGKVAILPLVSEILIITPGQDSVICSQGWYSLALYRQVYDTVSIDTSQGSTVEPSLSLNDDRYMVLVMKDTTARRDKSVLCLLFMRKTMADLVRSMLNGYATAFEILLDGQTVSWASEDAGSKPYTTQRTASGVFLSLSISYKSYHDVMSGGSMAMFAFTLFAMVIISTLTALLVTMWGVKPINDMILSFGGARRDLDNPYRFIYEYVNAFSKGHTQLNEENENLRASRRHFLSVMRNEIVLGMLTNPDFDFEGEYVRTAWPWLAENRPFLIAAYRNRRPEQAAPPPERFCPTARHECYAVIDQETWLILWFDGDASLEEGHSLLNKALQSCHFVVSGRLDDKSCIHETYLSMRADLERIRERWLTLPVLTQTRLVSCIRANKRGEAMQVLREACAAYQTDAVLWVLIRLAGEYGIDIQDYLDRYQKAMNGGEPPEALLDECAGALCREIVAGRQTEGHSGDEVCEYIRHHFDDSQLSVNELSDRFKLHRTIISRLVKAETDMTFSDYLSCIRMRRAAELLENSDESIAAIGEKVGIPSYSTFKRNFISVYECSPKEWREKRRN